jgi:acyl-coenzyme A thioesterase 9
MNKAVFDSTRRIFRLTTSTVLDDVHNRIVSTRTSSTTSRTITIGPGEETKEKIETSNISVSLFKNPIVHKLWTARQEAKKKSLEQKLERSNNTSTGLSSTKDILLQGRKPSDSRVEVSYPFSTDAMLWDSYRDPWGDIRMGKILEDLDALAGNVAFFHVDDSLSTIGTSNHPIIVTASVDKISLHDRPMSGSNQKLFGQVTWTGKSSMEIRMKCIQEGCSQEWLDAYVTFVTLDPISKKPTKLPPLVPSTPEEIADFDAGAIRAKMKKVRRMKNQSNTTSNEVQVLAETLLTQAGPLLNMPSLADPHTILLKNTKMQNAEIAQPQTQNLHNRIFGGFLMRRAFELAFSNAYLFGGSRPIFVEVDEVSFTSPVDVGDLLVFNSCVLYTEDEVDLTEYFHDYHRTVSFGTKLPLVHIEVEAWVTEPEKVSAKLSNLFSFTFALSPKPNDSTTNASEHYRQNKVRRVLPSNIDEARRMAKRIISDAEQRKL